MFEKNEQCVRERVYHAEAAFERHGQEEEEEEERDYNRWKQRQKRTANLGGGGGLLFE